MGRKVNVIDPSNKRVITVSADVVPDLEALGYVVETPEMKVGRLQQQAESDYYSGAGQTALAGVEGLARGATLGVSDIFMGDEAAKRAAAHPWVSTGADLLGSLLPAVLTGGASEEVTGAELGAEAGGSLIGRLAGATPAGLLQRGAAGVGERLGGGLVGKAATGAIEGAGFGLGGEISRTQLSGDPLTVEGAIAGAGWGSVFGLGAGLLGAGLESASSRLTRGASLEEETAAALRQTGETSGSTVMDSVPAAEAVAEQPLRYKGVTSEGAMAEASDGVLPGRHWDDFKAEVHGISDAADEAVKQATEAHKVALDANNVSRADRIKQVGDIGAKVDAATMASGKASAEIKSATRSLKANWRWLNQAIKADNPALFETRMASYRESVEKLADASGQSVTMPTAVKAAADHFESVADFHQAARSLRASMPSDPNSLFALGRDKAEVFFGSVGKVMASDAPGVGPLQSALKDQIAKMAEQVGIKGDEGPMNTLRKIWASGQTARQGAARDFAAEARRVARPAGIDLPKPDDSHYDYETEYSGQKGKEAKPVKEPKQPKTPDSISQMVKKLLIKKAALAAAGGVLGADLGHPLAGAIVGAMLGGKGRALTAVREAAAKVVSKAGSAVSTAGPMIEPLARTMYGTRDSGTRDELFVRRSREIRDMQSTGKDQAFAAALALTGAGHPDAAKGMYDVANKAIEVLAARLPKSPPGTNWGTEYLWKAPPEQVMVFSQEHHAVTVPTEFLAFAAEHPEQVFPSAIQALKTVFPSLYQEFRTQLIMNLADAGTSNMSHGKLSALSVIADTSLAPTMTPLFIAGQSSMFTEPPPQAPNAGSAGNKPVGRPGANDPTAAQRTEMR